MLHFYLPFTPEFKIYLLQEFDRLKVQEQQQFGWDIKRNLAKINYTIHTDAIKENLIPLQLTAKQIGNIYVSEANVLNVALFGKTAKQWRDENPELKGNIRDYANVSQLVCLSNKYIYDFSIPMSAEFFSDIGIFRLRIFRCIFHFGEPLKRAADPYINVAFRWLNSA